MNDPNRFEMREGGGFLFLFGLPFFMFGLGFLFATMLVGSSTGLNVTGVVLGAIFTVVGLMVMLGPVRESFRCLVRDCDGLVGIPGAVEEKRIQVS